MIEEILVKKSNGDKVETYEEKTKDDATDKKPFSGLERDWDAAIASLALVENLIGPGICGQHGYGGEDIEHVDEERL